MRQTENNIEAYFLTAKRGQIYREAIGHTERMLIRKALEFTCGNQITAAKLLGVHRNTLRTKIRRFHIDAEKFKL